VDHHWWQKLFRKQLQNDSGPEAALGAYLTCNEYAAVIKRITRQLNTSLRASQYMQISGNIALMLPILQIHQVD
jgi:hypothetical protein